jgi:hypothetical protein
MVLNSFQAELQQYGYKNHTVQISVGNFGHSLSPLARGFISMFTKGYSTWGSLCSEKRLVDDNELLSFYINDLNEDSKTEVLGYLTFLIHEITHHIDHTITPYGLNFHTKACLEFLGFQKLIPILLESYPNLLDGKPFISAAQDISKYPKIEKELNELYGKSSFFDAYRPSYNSFKVKLGWNGNTSPVKLFNMELVKVTIHGFMQTVQIPSNNRCFLSVNTILECRAMCHSLLWILYLFGNQESAKNEVRRYLYGYYREASPDYKFLIDAMGYLFGSCSFEQLLDNMNVESIRQVLMSMGGLCWYALQAPPLMDGDSLHNSVPPVRLILAMRELESCFNKGRQFQAFTEFLDELDQSNKADNLNLKPIEDILSFSLEYGKYIVNKNKNETKNKLIADHFSYVLKSQVRQIQRRQGKGYSSQLGLPEDGNPLFDIQDEADAEDLLTEFKTNQETINWFKLRENFLFRFYQSEEVRHQLINFFVV